MTANFLSVAAEVGNVERAESKMGRLSQRDKRLLLEELGLGGGGSASGLTPGDADDAEDLDLGESGARDEDPERVAIEIGRRETDAVVEKVDQVVGDNAFENVAVAEIEADPQAIEFGAAEEGFALGLKGFGEFLHEIDGLDLVEGHGLEFAFAGEQLGALGAAQASGIHIARNSAAIGEEDDGLLVSRGWGGFSSQSRALWEIICEKAVIMLLFASLIVK